MQFPVNLLECMIFSAMKSSPLSFKTPDNIKTLGTFTMLNDNFLTSDCVMQIQISIVGFSLSKSFID